MNVPSCGWNTQDSTICSVRPFVAPFCCPCLIWEWSYSYISDVFWLNFNHNCFSESVSNFAWWSLLVFWWSKTFGSCGTGFPIHMWEERTAMKRGYEDEGLSSSQRKNNDIVFGYVAPYKRIINNSHTAVKTAGATNNIYSGAHKKTEAVSKSSLKERMIFSNSVGRVTQLFYGQPRLTDQKITFAYRPHGEVNRQTKAIVPGNFEVIFTQAL